MREKCSADSIQSSHDNRVRALVRTSHGSIETSDWYPAGSSEAMSAMEVFIQKHSDFRAVGWESFAEWKRRCGMRPKVNPNELKILDDGLGLRTRVRKSFCPQLGFKTFSCRDDGDGSVSAN